jgi:hypothetical protein
MAKVFNRDVRVQGTLGNRDQVVVDASGVLYLKRVTETERDALEVEDGAVVYNTDDDAVNVYADGSWEEVTFED